MHQFGWLSKRGGNFLNLLQKEGGTQKGGGGSLRKAGVPTLEETMNALFSKYPIGLALFRFRKPDTDNTK